VHSGEILGVAGVAGNGQRELAEVIVGLRPITSGRLCVGGRDLTRVSVRDRLLAGVAYVPEDRLREGILPHLSLAETLALGLHNALFRRAWLFDEQRVRALARAAIADYRIAAPNEGVASARLSGGNIQKVLVARAMLLASRAPNAVLVALNPARGLDLGTTEAVHQRLLELRGRGGAVLLVYEDLTELLRLADRVLVMYRGRITGTFARSEFDLYQIGALMTGGAPSGPGDPG
jgi:simple sugar transport system ATP-binding protein